MKGTILFFLTALTVSAGAQTPTEINTPHNFNRKVRIVSPTWDDHLEISRTGWGGIFKPDASSGHKGLRLDLIGAGSSFYVLEGNVGVGTPSPNAQLHLASNQDHELRISRASGMYGFRIFRDATHGNILFQNTDDNNVTGTRIMIPEGGGAWQNLYLNPDGGDVGIGTTDPKGYKLAVNGRTITEEVVVKLYGSWPDYVFEDNYNLPSLSDLERYIKANKHLPDVPTAEQVKENGLSVGEMNAILLKKVEELTLHLIEKEKKDQQQSHQIQLLVDELGRLQSIKCATPCK